MNRYPFHFTVKLPRVVLAVTGWWLPLLAAELHPRLFSVTGCRNVTSEVGKRVAENFVVRKLDYEINPKRQYVIYPEVCALVWLADACPAHRGQGSPAAFDREIRCPTDSRGAKRIGPNAHVDYRVFGTLPLEIYLQSKLPAYLESREKSRRSPVGKDDTDGITSEARYWIDDMYMITAVQVQAYRATGDSKYIDRAALTMAAYLDKLQQPNGLFFHAPTSPFYWGRGNGWVAAGMAELLRDLPANHPARGRILGGYSRDDGLVAKIPRSGWSLAATHRPADLVAETSGTACSRSHW